jgi:hypothetical protein
MLTSGSEWEACGGGTRETGGGSKAGAGSDRDQLAAPRSADDNVVTFMPVSNNIYLYTRGGATICRRSNRSAFSFFSLGWNSGRRYELLVRQHHRTGDGGAMHAARGRD